MVCSLSVYVNLLSNFVGRVIQSSSWLIAVRFGCLVAAVRDYFLNSQRPLSPVGGDIFLVGHPGLYAMH